MKKFNELQRNSGKQFHELRNEINEQRSYFSKKLKL